MRANDGAGPTLEVVHELRGSRGIPRTADGTGGEDTFGRMCGEAYVYYYDVFRYVPIDDLEWAVAEIQYYLDVKSEIEGTAADPR